jgi:putative endonuclease
MKQFNRKVGQIAEDLATQELRKKGYQILERNYGNKFGEIDIIAKDGETLVFVEVKAKIGDDFGHPEEMINPGKLAKVRNMANIYLGDTEALCRIDVVGVVLTSDYQVLRLSHYENVY